MCIVCVWGGGGGGEVGGLEMDCFHTICYIIIFIIHMDVPTVYT
jgi:hypothetical protein